MRTFPFSVPQPVPKSLFPSSQTWQAYAQLVRLPNLPTAWADILLAALAANALPSHPRTFLLLLLASTSLYWGGMVWNDFFDFDQDRRERPFRPLPSGRIQRQTAKWLGVGLLGMGWVLALLAGWSEERGPIPAVALLASGLIAAIVLYDGWLKRTWAGPFGMGACRFFHVLLGLAACGALDQLWCLQLACVVGVYIVGVTWFARTEASVSSPLALRGAALVMLASLLLALPLPIYLLPGQSSPLFPYLLVALGLLVGIPVCRAISNPNPARVQTAVKQALLGLIILDAMLATAFAGNVGLIILVLLIPLFLLRRWRWLYAT